jgi:hypothetical protein
MPRTYVRRDAERQPRGQRRRTGRVYAPKFIDPFFWITASEPEKMVMTELVRRGIYFEHTPQTNTLPWEDWMFSGGVNPRTWEADMLLPQYKIWIEVQGTYFHTLPGQIETDALRFTYIEMIGWRPIFWWEEDIRMRLQDIMDAVPEFYRVNRVLEDQLLATARRTEGLTFYEGGTVDHLAGLRAALRKRGRPPQLRYRRRRRRMPK